MKLMIWTGILVGGTVGELVGGIFDHGSWLGAWGIIGSTVGSLLGLVLAYKIAKNYL